MGFLRYEFGGFIFGGAYKWRGLFSEFYGMCFPFGGTRITTDMCLPFGATQITRDMCFPGGGTQITRDMCFHLEQHKSLGIYVSQVGDTYH